MSFVQVEDLEYNVEDDGEDTLFERSCMNIQHLYKDNKQFMESIREPVQSLQPPDMCQRQASSGCVNYFSILLSNSSLHYVFKNELAK